MPKSERLPRRYSPHHCDIFALVKHQLADNDLVQDPLLVFPGDESRVAKNFWKQAAVHKGVKTHLDADRAEALKELADALQMYPQYGRAIKYMRSLAGVLPYPRLDAQPLEFIKSGGISSGSLVVARLPPRPARPQAHQLHVRFHRRGWRSGSREKKTKSEKRYVFTFNAWSPKIHC